MPINSDELIERVCGRKHDLEVAMVLGMLNEKVAALSVELEEAQAAKRNWQGIANKRGAELISERERYAKLLEESEKAKDALAELRATLNECF